MNLWQWVWEAERELNEQGHKQLSGYIDSMPTDTCNGRHDQVDAYAEDAITQAKELKLNWVEIFLRHWRLQSAILHRAQPKDMVKEAVSLLEFSSSPENSQCPQSVCVVQDLASCYGFFDGPGYAEERIAVSQEGLSKIDPSWGCYTCISTEQADALLDQGKYTECIKFIDETNKKLVAAGQGKDLRYMLLTKVTALVMLGEYDQARKQLSKATDYTSSSFLMNKKVEEAFLEAKSGDHKLAMETLPAITETKKAPAILYRWAGTLFTCMQAHEDYVTSDNIAQLVSIAEDMEKRGVYRQAFTVFSWLSELSTDKNTVIDVMDVIASMERIQPSLKQDLGAQALIELAKSRE